MSEEFNPESFLEEFLELANERTPTSGVGDEFLQVILEPGIEARPPEWDDRKVFWVGEDDEVSDVVEQALAYLAEHGTPYPNLRYKPVFKLVRVENTQLGAEPGKGWEWNLNAFDQKNPVTGTYSTNPEWEYFAASLRETIGKDTDFYRNPVWAHLSKRPHPWFDSENEVTHVKGIASTQRDGSLYIADDGKTRPNYLTYIKAIFKTKEELLAYMEANGVEIWTGEEIHGFDPSIVTRPTSHGWEDVSDEDWVAARNQIIEHIKEAPNTPPAKKAYLAEFNGWASDEQLTDYWEVVKANVPF